MRSHARKFWLGIAAALVAAVTVTTAQQQPAPPPHSQTAPLTATIPVDPLITVRTLPNGLRYYVRANRIPAGRAELRLVVKAGSVLEDDDQRGLAHFVEHMSFNGTQHFPKQEVAAFMQRLGMRFGAHVNAHTGFDETVYELQIPTSNPAIIDQSLLIMEDWARNVAFEPEEIERERGVILEEWRLGLGAEARIRDVQMPVLLSGSRYAERLPIGLPEVIRTASRDKLLRFYRDWYRPDLMGVIVVGDFDRAAVEKGIVGHFGSIPAPASPRPRQDFGVPDKPGTRYSVVTDKEMTTTTVGVFGYMAARDQMTLGAYRQQMVERLFSGILSERLDEIANKPGAPFLAAQTSRGLLVRSAEVTTLNALVPEDGVSRGLTAMLAETERVARFGFTQSELDRQKLGTFQYLEQAMIERDKSPSAPLADEFIRNFMQDEPIPGIAYEYGLSQRFLPTITLEEVNRVAKTWVPDGNRVVTVTGPEGAKQRMPTETVLAAAIKGAADAKMAAYVDTVSGQPLLDPLPTAGSVAATKAIGNTGVTEWRLSNGARVVLKPTTIKEDEILFRAVSPGGTSLASDADFVAASTADEVVAQGGLGKLSRLDLSKVLAGVNTAVRPDISETEEGLQGGSTKRDLEKMFQLIHLTFTAPRADPEAFAVFTSQLKILAANQEAQPEAAFRNALSAALTQDNPRARPLTPALVDRMNLDKSLAFYKDRFADASDFTFVFVGSFDLPGIKPLVERYIASLPAINRKEAAKDVGMSPPSGVVEKHVKKGIDPKSQVSIVFTGPFQDDEKNRTVVSAMAALLSGDLFRTLREDLGGTYGISVEPTFRKFPKEQYSLSINFGCDPARMDELIKTAFRIIDEFRQTGPSAARVADAKLAVRRDLESDLQQNRYLLNEITDRYSNGEDVSGVFVPPAALDELTPEIIRDAARQYLNKSRYVEVTLSPEGKHVVMGDTWLKRY
jgi:zinc protease